MQTKADKRSAILTFLVLIVLILIFITSFLRSPGWKLSPVMKCATGMSALGKALLIYANDHNDTFPNSIDSLARFYTESDKCFACPASGVEYILVQGRTSDMSRNLILAYCPVGHQLYDPNIDGIGKEIGINIFSLDNLGQTLTMNEAIQLFSEQGIDINSIKHNMVVH